MKKSIIITLLLSVVAGAAAAFAVVKLTAPDDVSGRMEVQGTGGQFRTVSLDQS